ncbi:major facilitator superfamily transporter [Diplogelasinospora grovesii]|uniref:Major facilitator superfamily transporter n=1 Tax=Diplogelasinospora grovesii TaxID=303347 RepID=A0AAN6NFJ4_9PEZI|nr:major facilitator superfamily transporter [Diplogelasinospora grovesii]
MSALQDASASASATDGPGTTIPNQSAETAQESGSSHQHEPKQDHEKSSSVILGVTRRLATLEYIPKRCRWDPANPPRFNWGLCLLFALGAAFTIGNLYYYQPILNILAEDFGVSFEEVSQVPTLMQAGYAAGGLFISPLGDMFRRRPLILFLVFVTANVWLGLCLSTSFDVFRALSFTTALTSVTPQLMLPLAAELAPHNKRATAISVAFGGVGVGMLLARILSGIVTQFTTWRTIYFIAFGLQYLLLCLLFLFFPDFPSVNPEGVSYLRVLYTIVTLPFHHATLVQASLIAFLINAAFVAFWTTLTFLLAAPPFRLSTLDIGLFALIGLPPFLLNPFVSYRLTDRYHPVYSCILGLLIGLGGSVFGTFVSTSSLAGPVVQGITVDLAVIMGQTANRKLLVAVDPKAHNCVNTVFMVSSFCGTLTGAAVGSRLYAEGGWRYSGGANIAFFGAALLVCLARGPHEKRWVGWRGGWGSWRKGAQAQAQQEKGQQLP